MLQSDDRSDTKQLRLQLRTDAAASAATVNTVLCAQLRSNRISLGVTCVTDALVHK